MRKASNIIKDILMAEKYDIDLDDQFITVKYDDNSIKIALRSLEPLEAVIIRHLFALPRPVVVPGQSTKTIIEGAIAKREQDKKDLEQAVTCLSTHPVCLDTDTDLDENV